MSMFDKNEPETRDYRVLMGSFNKNPTISSYEDI